MSLLQDNTASTEWERIERDGLLTLETPEWREKRRIAEDPDTTSEILDKIFVDIVVGWSGLDENETLRKRLLCLESVAAHPNIPRPHWFRVVWLLRPYRHFDSPTDIDISDAPHGARGFCRNPTALRIPSENPDIWNHIDVEASENLLREENLSLILAEQLMQFAPKYKETARYSASLHVSVAGEI